MNTLNPGIRDKLVGIVVAVELWLRPAIPNVKAKREVKRFFVAATLLRFRAASPQKGYENLGKRWF